ncbi:sodium-dependent neutral amino acid transporter B(0)AT3-like isoform X2 [Corythoichthys intestinalis]|uniref:sodium-dependent neutral amino acid transporter B(0)AT3-like isoform X2 n=1 Tax=Corythoichthys intestinalis TaxID=161448 RepID=UPI0025A4E046|nr:sodium-dependent neutral amino acid transporter B(0)AT3-like isoform X2 [Corythoichthys intestinalis]
MDKTRDAQEEVKWKNKVEYMLTSIGFAVGIGNVWRFPFLCQTYGGGLNEECVISTPVNFFWYRQTLNITTDIKISGSPQWWLVVCLACAWLTMYICIIKGIQSMGKAVYVTTTLPYVVLTIFLVRALTLPGATDGLVYLFTPDWEILKNPQVWLDASTQIFFSLSVAFGGLIAISSYANEKNNCEKDAVIVGLINSGTSLYGAISIFAILGFKANNGYNSCLNGNILTLTNHFEYSDQNITRDNYDHWVDYLNSTYPDELSSLQLKPCNLKTFLDQSASGTGLAFIVFTEAVLEMPGSQLWAVLFFLMLFSLGLSSMFGNAEGVLRPFSDLNLVPKSVPKELITGAFCLMSFLISLIFTMGSGNYWVEVFNGYVGSVPLLIIALFELIGVVYIYGMNRFSEDIRYMTGKRPNLYWKICWTTISPLMLLVVLIAYVVLQAQRHPTYPAWNPAYEHFPKTEDKPYPDFAFAVIVLLCTVPVVSIPLVAIYKGIQKAKWTSSTKEGLNPYGNDGFEPEAQ